jgi:hypothetical protein
MKITSNYNARNVQNGFDLMRGLLIESAQFATEHCSIVCQKDKQIIGVDKK